MSVEQIAWSLKTCAAALDMSYYTIHTAVRSGQLKAYRLGSRYYVEPSDARAFLRSLADGTTGPDEDT